MAFTCKQMIQMAYRRAGLANRHRVVNETEVTQGLEVLQRMWNDMIASGTWGRFTKQSTIADDTYTPSENERVVTTNSATVFTIPVTLTDPDDGLTRVPRDGTVIQTSYTGADDFNSYIYDAQTNRWISVADLGINDAAPFYGRYGEKLTAMLAVLLADEVGQQVTPVLARQAGLARTFIAAKWDQERRPAQHCYM